MARLRMALGADPEAELWGEHGLLAATMRCVRAVQDREDDGKMNMLLNFINFDRVELDIANAMLLAWGHKMGELHRGNQLAMCHALFHEGQIVAVTTASTLIAPTVGGCHWMTRENTVELSRLCACRSGLCRIALRLWREFVFPATGYKYAMSYQDADLHSGNTYRFDGWDRVGRSRSGTDTRSGRPGRDKWIWQWPKMVQKPGICP